MSWPLPWVQVSQKCPICTHWLLSETTRCGELDVHTECALPYAESPTDPTVLPDTTDVSVWSRRLNLAPEQLRRFDRWHVCAQCVTVTATNGWICANCWNSLN